MTNGVHWNPNLWRAPSIEDWLSFLLGTVVQHRQCLYHYQLINVKTIGFHSILFLDIVFFSGRLICLPEV